MAIFLIFAALSNLGIKTFHLHFKGGSTITHNEYNKFVQELSEHGCMIKMDWLKVYKFLAKGIQIGQRHFIHQSQYYPNEIDMFKNLVSNPGISMTYVSQNERAQPVCSGPTLHPFLWKLSLALYGMQMNCMQTNCMQCAKNKPYEL